MLVRGTPRVFEQCLACVSTDKRTVPKTLLDAKCYVDAQHSLFTQQVDFCLEAGLKALVYYHLFFLFALSFTVVTLTEGRRSDASFPDGCLVEQ